MTRIILLLISIILYQFTYSQNPCLPEGITFTTQAQIDSFPINYPNCTEIEGNLKIGSYLYPGNINNLSALIVLTSINGSLIIRNYADLLNLSGLENLTSIGESLIIEDDDLISLNGLESLNHVGLSVNISGDNIQNLNGLIGLQHIGGTLIIGYYEPTPAPIEYYCYGNSSLENINGLQNLIFLGGGLWVYCNDLLPNLDGLDKLTSIPGNLEVGYYGWQSDCCGNASLNSLSGLQNITSIGGNLMISGNNTLTDLSELENLTSIGGYLWINFNDVLSDLTGLQNLDSINGDLAINNNQSLVSIQDLENVEATSIENLNIINNPLLNQCAVSSICQYLASPNGDVSIYTNGPGCSNLDTIQAACDTLSVHDFALNVSFSISPNPTASRISIDYFLVQSSMVTISILNMNGDKLISTEELVGHQGHNNEVLNIKGLEPGIYFCELNSQNALSTRKIVKY